MQNITVPKNGYLFVYVSNESNFDVFFDNLQVIHKPSSIVEETHYYPFGLTMAGISSKAAGALENKKKYNGIEFDNDLDLNTYEAELRDLDPQLGKWWQVDPETENQEMWSPYASNYDNPILYQDPRGNEGEACCDGFLDAIDDAVDDAMIAAGGFISGSLNYATGGLTPKDLFGYRDNLTTKKREIFDGAFETTQDIIPFVPAPGRSPELIPERVPVNMPTTTGKPTKPVSPEVPVSTIKQSKSNSNSSSRTNPKNRVVNQKPGEKAQNQLEGIEKKQAKEKKNASSQGYKQNKITIGKSKQNMKTELKKIKNKKDASENF